MALYSVVFFFSFLISLILTNGIKQLSLSYGFHDVPDNDRKIHVVNVPTLGGIAIFISLWGSIVLLDATGISYFETIIFRIFFVSLFFIFIGISSLFVLCQEKEDIVLIDKSNWMIVFFLLCDSIYLILYQSI